MLKKYSSTVSHVHRRYDCNPKSSPGKRWYPDHCDGENLNHLYACQVPRGKQLNLTNIFHREYMFIETCKPCCKLRL